MRIFISARYGRREEMIQRAAELVEAGHEIVSRWLYVDGMTEDAREVEAATKSMPVLKAMPFAIEDLSDLDNAEVFIAFTEETSSPYGRGGRHVEYGIALEGFFNHQLKNIFIIGPRENIFHCLPGDFSRYIYHYPKWDLKQVKAKLDTVA